jgi:hypothetical protein
MEATVQRLGETEDRRVVVQNLRARKLENTRTSIVLGTDTVSYESDAMSRQKDILRAYQGAGMSSQLSDAKELRKSLVRSSFRIGLAEEPTNYQSSTAFMLGNESERSSWENIQKYRGTLDPKIDKFIKASSVHMGSDTTDFSTASQEAMTYRGHQIDYSKSNENSRKLKTALTRHHFELSHTGAEEAPSNRKVSSQNAAYTYDKKAFQDARSALSKEVMADLRKEHFSLGYSTESYPQRTSDSAPAARSAQDIHAEKERARLLKEQLLRTSLVIGTDQEYM